ncbi:uncharacterized protein [Leptinotarsa decemlineata]|uniref:uncharacterized protein n=1 Tax=Leptinotarsa decemlineata TaxID=7539 RepID=UPI003D30CB30
MSSGDESVDIPDEIDLIEEVEGEVDNPIETIEEPTEEEATPNTANKDSDDDEDSSKKVVKPKRVIRNPQPKLNEQTLRTSKGLPALTNHFKRVKFKGRGHEAEDLNVLMKTYEYWCHRLFPKFPFDACIARLETLGTKRGTQVLMKKIRLGMEIADDDNKMVSDEEHEGEAVATEGFRDTFDNRFDQLLTGNRESERTSEPDTTEEQLERIRQNRLRAEALRKQRLEKTKSMSQNETNMNNSSAGNVVSSADNILNIVNEDIESEKPEETEISSTSRSRVLSSDEEEIAHSEKLEDDDTENGGSIRRKKILTIESDDEPDTNVEENHIDTITNIYSQDETQTNEMEADDEEVDLDNILNIVNEETETSLKKMHTNLSHNETNQRLEQSQTQTDDMEEVDFDNILSIVNENTEIPTSKSPHQNRPASADNNQDGMIRTDNYEEENSNKSSRKKSIQGIESDEEMDTN